MIKRAALFLVAVFWAGGLNAQPASAQQREDKTPARATSQQRNTARRQNNTGTRQGSALSTQGNTSSSQRDADAQQGSEQPVSTDSADLAITATVTARELRFEAVPNPTVEFTGKPERRTEWSAERQNLPRPVQPGVTYRNIGIRLKIVSVFADIDRIVAEALGEVPVSNETTQGQNEKSATPAPQPSSPSINTTQTEVRRPQ